MARPLSTPSPSQMQARKKRRGVSVFLSRVAEQRFALSSQGPGPENPGQKHHEGSDAVRVQVPVLPGASRVTLSKPLNLSVPHFLICVTEIMMVPSSKGCFEVN